MSGACNHIALLTNNPRRLVNFYTKKLKFVKEREAMASKEIIRPIFGFSRDCRLIKLRQNNIVLEIISSTTGPFRSQGYNRIGYSHWAYGVKDKARFCNNLAKKRVPVINVKKDNGVVYFIKDPDGNLIEIQ